jgi:TonB family protein
LKSATFSPFVRSAVFIVLVGFFAVSGRAEERKSKSEIKPAYPELAKKMNLSGVVKVQVEISPTGTVTSAKALGGHPIFIDSALDAVRKWRFEAASSATEQIVEFKFVNPNSQ